MHELIFDFDPDDMFKKRYLSRSGGTLWESQEVKGDIERWTSGVFQGECLRGQGGQGGCLRCPIGSKAIFNNPKLLFIYCSYTITIIRRALYSISILWVFQLFVRQCR